MASFIRFGFDKEILKIIQLFSILGNEQPSDCRIKFFLLVSLLLRKGNWNQSLLIDLRGEDTSVQTITLWIEWYKR